MHSLCSYARDCRQRIVMVDCARCELTTWGAVLCGR